METSEVGENGEGDGMLEDDNAIHLSLAPQLNAMMIARHNRRSCCPQLFERAAKSWWNPKFDSEILEQQYVESSVPKLTIRFRYSLVFVLLSSIVWGIYWTSTLTKFWELNFGACFIIGLAALFLLIHTYSTHYQKHQFILSCITSSLFMVASLLPFAMYAVNIHHYQCSKGNSIFVKLSQPTIFTFYIEILLLVYTIIPLPLYIVVSLCSVYSIVFETLNITLLNDSSSLAIIIRVILHICLHLIGSHIMIMNEVRMRGTFMSVGQSLLVRRQYELEKALKETMINSVMPPKVSEWLMETTHTEEPENNYASIDEVAPILRKVSSSDNIAKAAMHPEGFRPFNMNVMDNVSILFADIVGFTRMSSNKTAEHLVGLLNDLFGRFDDLCVRNGCEKINTLGDCYYAVSGCPGPRKDHAECCVNMGLAMIEAIKQFDEDTNEDVNMRVGVHTGKVLCGIVGTMRFKFDVWSQDVTLANRMESTGKPGQVHITEDTYKFLDPEPYLIEEGPMIQDRKTEHKTYFISGKAEPQSTKQIDNYQNTIDSSPSSRFASSPSYNAFEKKSSSLPIMFDAAYETNCKGGKSAQYDSDEAINHTCINLESGLEEGATNNGPRANFESDETLGQNGSTLKIPHPFASNVDHILRLKLPKLSKSGDRDCDFFKSSRSRANSPAAVKTSLPKIIARFGGISEKENESELENCTPGNLIAPPPSLASSMPSSPGPPPPPSPQDMVEDSSLLQVKDPRKDSGIRSRRGSIQDQIFSVNGLNTGDLLVHRASDYFTTSHTSIVDSKFDQKQPLPVNRTQSTLHECEKKFLQMRKQSDFQMIKCVQRDRRSSMMASPLSRFTLFFNDSDLEKKYRLTAHKSRTDEPRTLASTLYNTYCDILVTFLVYLGISISLFLMFGWSVLWGTYFILSLLWHFLILLLCLYKVVLFSHSSSNSEETPVLNMVYSCLTRWRVWHACGGSLLCFPLIAVFTNFSCVPFCEYLDYARFVCYIAAVGIVHFCNFTQLNCWMKNILATLGTVIFLLLLRPFWCPFLFTTVSNTSIEIGLQENLSVSNFSFPNIAKDTLQTSYYWFHVECMLAYTLLLVLVWLLNREFEIGYRLSFYGYHMAMKDKVRVQNMKNLAELLLNNIIPQHVVNIIKTKTTTKYSKNHKNIGIMFASIVNFNELYSEDYSSGKEFMRFLNELVADFDELLKDERFKNIEKIKTIGSTYMAASGLNPQLRLRNAYPNQHVCDLVEFAKKMFSVVDNFNQNLIGFKFIMRIGLNCGDVTAGVIGTTKLFYDIWGDAVNIASRMDSTGVPGCIQVTEECANILRPMYKLDHRGSVYVKGKDDMDVFLVQVKSSEES